jgi:hypothetical protein
MNNRDRQKRDSDVIIVWCLLGLGAIAMMMLFFHMLTNLFDYIKI